VRCVAATEEIVVEADHLNLIRILRGKLRGQSLGVIANARLGDEHWRRVKNNLDLLFQRFVIRVMMLV